MFKFSTELVNINIESTKKFMCASIENDKVFEIYSDNLIIYPMVYLFKNLI